MSVWYTVDLRRIVKKTVYVKAASGKEATERVAQMDWEGETDDETVQSYVPGLPRRLKAIPRWLWEELGRPGDEGFATAAQDVIEVARDGE